MGNKRPPSQNVHLRRGLEGDSAVEAVQTHRAGTGTIQGERKGWGRPPNTNPLRFYLQLKMPDKI